MANQKINDIAAAGAVTDAMQFETDIGGVTPNRVTAEQVKEYIDTDELQIYSIGKEGSASNSGLNINAKLDTIANARDAIDIFRGGSWTPDPAEAQVIYGRDAGQYTAGFAFTTTNHQYIDFYYPNVRIYSAGNIINTGNNITVKEIIALVATFVVEKIGSGTASISAHEIKSLNGGTPCILVSGGRLDSNVDALTDVNGLPFFNRSLQVNSGSGYHRGNTASKDIFVDTGAYANVILGELTTDIYLEANATLDIFIVGTFGGKITAKAGAALNLICGKQLNSTGADSIDPTATFNKIVLSEINQIQAYEVGEEGRITNTGLNTNNKVLEPTTAAGAINTLRGGGWTPDPAEAQTINCRDAGTYSQFSLSGAADEYINMFFPMARLLSPTTTVGDNNSIWFKNYTDGIGSAVNIFKVGNGESTVYGEKMETPIGTGNRNIEINGGRLNSHVDHLVTNDAADKNIYIHTGVGSDHELYHRGFTADRNIDIEANAYANITLGNLDGDITLGANATLDIFILGIFGGKITATTGCVINMFCGNRPPGAADSLSGAIFNRIILRGDSSRTSKITSFLEELNVIDLKALGLSEISAGQVQSTASVTETSSFNMSVAANAGATTFLDSAIDKIVTFPDGVFSITSQGEFHNIDSGTWTFAAVAPSTVIYDDIATPLQPGEHALWRKVSSTEYLIMRKRKNRRVLTGAADYNPSVLTDDTTIFVDDTAAARNVIISTEDVGSGSDDNLRRFVIKDTSGGSATNNITISLESGDLDEAANFVLAINGGSITVELDGTNGWII